MKGGETVMPEKIATSKIAWDLILLGVTGAFGFILAGIRWYLLDLKISCNEIKKSVDDLDKKFSGQISHVHERIDTHLDKKGGPTC